ncbi:hypothetical protein PTKIN_Ptkin05aG0132600 [Pterospermum kingtungense]
METKKIPVCLSIKRYRRRKKYQRLKRMINTIHEENEKETISMLKKSIPKVSLKTALPVKPLRKWGDAYVDMMLTFAGNVTRLNNNGSKMGYFVRVSHRVNPVRPPSPLANWPPQNTGPGEPNKR